MKLLELQSIRSLPTILFVLLLDVHFTGAIAGSFLGEELVRKDPLQNIFEHVPAKTAGCRHIPTGPIETTRCDYETVESVNEELYETLHDLVATPFFRYYRADLYRECPFWQENGFCMNRECGIETIDESQIPEKWRAAELSKVEMPAEEVRNSLPGCYYRDSDFCFLDDTSEGDYIDLIQNPEKFTGYAGLSAQRVWSSIYNENCFGISEYSLMTGSSPAPVTLPDTLTDVLRAEGAESNEECLEKRVYYKIISGLHASISTHLCHDHLNQITGEWAPDLQCFVSRVASHPERLQYIYFNNVLMLRAAARLAPYLSKYDYCSSGTHEEDELTKAKLDRVIELANIVGKFDESVLFRGENANVLKEEFKAHFRNVSRIMDCVGCDKCRLWGKIQTSGVGTALKILFELDDKVLSHDANANLLSRQEVVAFINTLHRFSESLHFVNNFRKLWTEAGPEFSRQLMHDADVAISGTPRHEPPSASLTADISSPSSSPNRSGSTLQGLKNQLSNFASFCRQCTTDCMEGCSKVLDSVKAAIRTTFDREKINGPRHNEL